MKIGLRLAFYGALVLYGVYNVMWLIGTTFSFGRNDSRSELVFFLITFPADVPLMWLIWKRPMIGGAALLILLGTGMALGRAIGFDALNSFTVLWWYSPKLIMAAIAYGARKLSQQSLTVDPRV
jgi:hypothetical protein